MKTIAGLIFHLIVATLSHGVIISYNGPDVTGVRGSGSDEVYADLDNGVAVAGSNLSSTTYEIRIRYNTVDPFLAEVGDENASDFIIQIGGGNTPYISAIAPGTIIGPGLNYRGPDGDRDGGFLVKDNGSGVITSVGSDWDNVGTSAIAGFVHDDNGTPTYGWIEVSYTFSDDINASHEVTIHRFAWEDSGIAIIAGQFVAVPEPSQLGLIFSFFVLISFMAKRKR